NAVSQTRRLRSVGKNVSLVSIANTAEYLNAVHAVAVIGFIAHNIIPDRLGEAGPPGARPKFICRIKQLSIAADTGVAARLVRLAVFARTRFLGTVLPGYQKLLFGELILPLFFTLFNASGWFRAPVSSVLIYLFPVKHLCIILAV